MANTTLRQAFSDIANAIRAKGVSGTMTPLQMPTKVASIIPQKYGVSIDNLLGVLTQQGILYPSTQQFQFSSDDIVSTTDDVLQYRFYNNTKLTSVSLPNLTTVSSGMKYAFYGCTSLTSVSFPSLTSVGSSGLNYAFNGCTSLTSISFPSLTTIGQYGMSYAFRDCTSLTSVDLSSLTTIGQYGMQYAFTGCTSLQSADLSNILGGAGGCWDYVFQNCTNLRTVKMNKFSYAGSSQYGGQLYQTFSGCTHLEIVDFSEAVAVPSLYSTSVFQNTNNTFKIVVPDSLYDSWIVATNWSTYASHIVKASEYTPAS